MTCPFALFSRTLSDNGKDDGSSSSSIAGSSRSKLTSQLKSGTWKAHREIEKSAGVRALMGSHHAEFAVQFDRMDHLKFLIMLGCIYLTMEDVLFNSDSVLRDMMPLLTRSEVLLDDIQVHLDEILSSRGAKVSELDHTADEEAEVYHSSIVTQVHAAQISLQRINVLHTSSLITADHIALLTKRQAKAVKSYLDRIVSVPSGSSSRRSIKDEGVSFTPLTASPSEKSAYHSSFITRPNLTSRTTSKARQSNHLILSHAYVRYMGDLSGGQHIVRRLSKLFPIYSSNAVSSQQNQGFRFYSFISTGKSSNALKDMIRDRLDAIDLNQSEIKAIVDEASQAFLLNGKVLDSLVDEVDTSMFAIKMARSNRITLSTRLHSITSLMIITTAHLYHSPTLALLAASLLFVGLASAFIATAF